MDEAHRPVLRGAGADVRFGDRVIAAEDDRDRACREHLAHRLLDRRMRPGCVAWKHGGVAEVDDAQDGKGVKAGLQMRAGLDAGAPNRAWPESCPWMIRDEVVHRRAENRRVNVRELRWVFGVGQSREGEQAGVVGLLSDRRPARHGIDHRLLRVVSWCEGTSSDDRCGWPSGLSSSALAVAASGRRRKYPPR